VLTAGKLGIADVSPIVGKIGRKWVVKFIMIAMFGEFKNSAALIAMASLYSCTENPLKCVEKIPLD